MVTTLGVVGAVHVITPEEVEEKVPQGCGYSAVNKEVGVHMMLRGFIDVCKEINSLEKELTKLTKQIDGLHKKMTVPGYESKVPEKIRNDNTVKMESLREMECHLKEGVEKMRSIA
uniref:valine--tRNA ligase n=1 Tax=Lygus hesperus TaxID=30085 RepID=A0A0A9VZG4_LYGHE